MSRLNRLSEARRKPLPQIFIENIKVAQQQRNYMHNSSRRLHSDHSLMTANSLYSKAAAVSAVANEMRLLCIFLHLCCYSITLRCRWTCTNNNRWLFIRFRVLQLLPSAKREGNSSQFKKIIYIKLSRKWIILTMFETLSTLYRHFIENGVRKS